jgi:hypothetical protein
MAFMSSPAAASLSPEDRVAVDALTADLSRIFGARLRSLVAYGLDARADGDDPLRTLALVEHYGFDDLNRCAPLVRGWRRLGLAVPLLLTRHEFIRTLDVFPLEYGNLIATHVVILTTPGEAPFDGTHVSNADRRRGCEQQAKSHLIHLREGFLETGGNPPDVAELIAASAPAFRALLVALARLELSDAANPDNDELAAIAEETIGVPASLIKDILAAPKAASSAADPAALMARYIDASERIWRFVDGWRP